MFDFESREREDQDNAAAEYDALYHDFPVAEYWDEDFTEFVGAFWVKGDRVLDLGCGPASLHERWSKLPEPARLVGVDISPAMVNKARSRFPDSEFVVARAHELPFADGSFDLVIASSVLHHIPDDHLESALQEIARVLDEHGRLVGREPVQTSWGREPGWFSGALMTFRHLVFRLTRSREYPEPELGEHHHVFEELVLTSALSTEFHVSCAERRLPFSPLVLRATDTRVAALAQQLDRQLADRPGEMLYFAAERNYATAADVSRAVAAARTELAAISDVEFLALLEAAAAELERIFSGPKS
jgi:ubiquinone/menaquinone biosynthesis C-methylase UbiE